MIELLKTRFESNRIHRGELSWAVVLARLEAHPEALDALQELLIPFDYVAAEWLPKAVQDTAKIWKKRR